MCAIDIPVEADQCAHCGHKGVRHTPLEKLTKRWFWAWVLTFSVVGAPIGLPAMFWYGLRMRRAKRRHPEWTRPAEQA